MLVTALAALLTAMILAAAARYGYCQGKSGRFPSIWLILGLLAITFPSGPLHLAGIAIAYALGYGIGAHPRAKGARVTRREAARFLQAIARGELVVHYQPIIDLETGAMIGVEALSRWRHPVRGMLPPSEWLHITEDPAVVAPFAKVVRGAAIRQAREWPMLRVSINVVAARLCDEEWAGEVLMALHAADVPPTQLTIEVTEGQLITNPDVARHSIETLSRAGVKVALDDFGTGYASIKYLTMFPFDYVKIDRTFIRELGLGQESYAKALATLAVSLGIDALAEGVETPAEAQAAIRLGCRFAQGYRYGKPVPAAAITSRLVTEPWRAES